MDEEPEGKTLALAHRHQVARKDYPCDNQCKYGDIKAGTIYLYEFSLLDGKPVVSRVHSEYCGIYE